MTAIPPNGAEGTNRPDAIGRAGNAPSRLDASVKPGSGPGLAPLTDAMPAVSAPHAAFPASTGCRVARLGTAEWLRVGLPRMAHTAILHAQLQAGLGPSLLGRLSRLMRSAVFTGRPPAHQASDIVGTIVPLLMVNMRSDRNGL